MTSMYPVLPGRIGFFPCGEFLLLIWLYFMLLLYLIFNTKKSTDAFIDMLSGLNYDARDPHKIRDLLGFDPRLRTGDNEMPKILHHVVDGGESKERSGID